MKIIKFIKFITLSVIFVLNSFAYDYLVRPLEDMYSTHPVPPLYHHPSQMEIFEHDNYDYDISKKFTVKPGEVLNSLLNQIGIAWKDQPLLINTLSPYIHPRRLKVGHSFYAFYKKRPIPFSGDLKIVALQVPLDSHRRLEVICTEGTHPKFSANIHEMEFSKELVWRGGLISGNLLKTSRSWNIPSNIMHELIAAMGHYLDFRRDIRKDTRIEILIEKCLDQTGTFSHYGNIVYAILSTSNKSIPLFWHESEENHGFFNENGERSRKFLLNAPVPGGKITGYFGWRQEHPVLGCKKMHTGIDFKAKYGTSVWATGDGRIKQIGFNGGYGRFISIEHPSMNLETRYAHLSSYAPGLKKGSWVKQGEHIGKVGQSGRTTGPHLHYEVKIGGRLVNPLKLDNSSVKKLKLTGPDLEQFIERKNILMETLRYLRDREQVMQKYAFAPN